MRPENGVEMSLIFARESEQLREHVLRLAEELGRYHATDAFARCRTMGEVTAEHIRRRLGL